MSIATTADVNHAAFSAPSLIMEDRFCPGCQKSVVTEDGGVVVAFGQSFFHVDCFKCAKCGQQVTADTNLLLLSDGSPVCANCSYSCSVCRQPILDEAIMTGDDSYHAHCFKCKTCHKKIDELMFAKSSQGIYCMECHSERVARSRRHAQRQAEREREKERERERENAARVGAGGNGSVSSRESATTENQTDAGRGHTNAQPRPSGPSSRPGTASSVRSGTPTIPDAASTTKATRDGSKSFVELRSGDRIANGHTYSASPSSAPVTIMGPTLTSPPPRTTSKPNPSLNTDRSGSPPGRPSDGSSLVPIAQSASASAADHARSATTPASRMDSLSVPLWPDNLATTVSKKKSFDDGVRPLNLLHRQLSNASLHPGERSDGPGLAVTAGTNSRRDKRRSINPAMALAHSFSAPPAAESAPSSPYEPANGTPRHGNVLTMERTASPPPLHYTSLSVQHTGRARSASSSTYLPEHPISSAHSSPRPSFTLDGAAPYDANHNGQYHHHAAASDASILDDRLRNGESRRPPDLNLANGHIARAQRSFNDRSRSNSPSHVGVELELPQKRTAPSSPTSPAHYIDVPRGVESGTDTEAEGEETHFLQDAANGQPPPPPPKDARGGKPIARPPQLNLDSIDFGRDSSDGGHSGEGTSEMSLDSSPVERTSHSTFIAPALPPIRISMGGTDFSDLLKFSGASEQVAKLRELAEVKEEESAKLDEILDRTLTAPPAAVSRRASRQLSTPRSDTTIIGSEEASDQGRDAKLSNGGSQRSREPSRDRSGSNTPSSSASLNDRALHAFPPMVDARRAPSDGVGEPPSRNPRSSVESIIGFMLSDEMQQAHPSLDLSSQKRERAGSNASFHRQASLDSRSPARITVTGPDTATFRAAPSDMSDVVKQRLQEAVSLAVEHGSSQVRLEVDFAQSVLSLLNQQKDEYNTLRRQLDGFKRTSQRYMEGFTVAQTEYDREAKARRDAEAEVTRLRVLLSGQAVRLAAISGESKRQEIRKQLTDEMNESLSTLEKDVSKLKAERDMMMAEVEQLSETRSYIAALDSDEGAARVTRALSLRFDDIRNQYKTELDPLTEQRETLAREVVELKAFRDAILEEATRLSARNEELAQLGTQYARRIDTAPVESVYSGPLQERVENIIDQGKSSLSLSVTSSTMASDESMERYIKVGRAEAMDPPPQSRATKFIKWPGSKAPKENVAVVGPDANKQKGRKEHVFQQISVLRVARCDHCGDKMWGSQFRCTSCNVAVHTRCIQQVNLACTPQAPLNGREPAAPAPSMGPLPPSLFGRDLIEQVRADSRDEPRLVPVIVEKCIDAVDALALDFEGVYRKTGGSGLSRTITQLFERGDYNSFDLKDTDRFNDICSVTSVLKTYFRSLPNPLLTYDLHEKFVEASTIRDDERKTQAYTELVNELPKEHYHTARVLMLHLHRVREKSETNLMHAQNLGVVFGPTLMRSRDPAAEFSDMAGKALAVMWLVENAPTIFSNEEQQQPPAQS